MIEKIKSLFSGLKTDKRLFFLVVIGALGVILLVISEALPETSISDEESTNDTIDFVDHYEVNLEERLESLLGCINGAGKVEVMITLASGDENVYATEQKQSEKSSEQKYVIVDNSNEEAGLLLKVSEPEIRGIGIVCDGSDSPQVRQEIINTVSAVLNISSNRISIAKMKNQ